MKTGFVYKQKAYLMSVQDLLNCYDFSWCSHWTTLSASLLQMCNPSYFVYFIGSIILATLLTLSSSDFWVYFCSLQILILTGSFLFPGTLPSKTQLMCFTSLRLLLALGFSMYRRAVSKTSATETPNDSLPFM